MIKTPRCLRSLCLALLAVALFGAADDPPKEFSRGVLIRFEGPITPRTEQYLYRKLDAACEMNADLVVVEIDSPGGYVDETLKLARRLRDTDWAHTVAYVPRQALSGAAIMALGCEEILMDPNAVLGDCGVIFQDEDFQFRHAPEKFRTHLVREMRDLATYHGRPPALAEAMANMDLIVHKVKNRRTDRVAYMSEKEIEADPNPADWEKLNPVHESREDHFLEVNGLRAVELGLAEGTIDGRAALEKHFQLREEFVILRPTGVDTTVYILNLPVVTGLLIIIGLVALYVEFSAPGIGLGGLVAFLCFAVFFWSRFLGGTAGWLEVVLFISGAVFLCVELFVTPGFGIAGLTGLLLLLASLVLAGQNFFVPSTEREWGVLGETLVVIGVSACVFLVAAIGLSHYFGTIPVLGRLALKPPEETDTKPGGAAAAPGDQVHCSGVRLGDHGLADSALRPAGRVRFGDQYVDVVTEGAFVDEGAEVRVLQIRGNRVLVRVVEKA